MRSNRSEESPSVSGLAVGTSWAKAASATATKKRAEIVVLRFISFLVASRFFRHPLFRVPIVYEPGRKIPAPCRNLIVKSTSPAIVGTLEALAGPERLQLDEATQRSCCADHERQ